MIETIYKDCIYLLEFLEKANVKVIDVKSFREAILDDAFRAKNKNDLTLCINLLIEMTKDNSHRQDHKLNAIHRKYSIKNKSIAKKIIKTGMIKDEIVYEVIQDYLCDTDNLFSSEERAILEESIARYQKNNENKS